MIVREIEMPIDACKPTMQHFDRGTQTRKHTLTAWWFSMGERSLYSSYIQHPKRKWLILSVI